MPLALLYRQEGQRPERRQDDLSQLMVLLRAGLALTVASMQAVAASASNVQAAISILGSIGNRNECHPERVYPVSCATASL